MPWHRGRLRAAAGNQLMWRAQLWRLIGRFGKSMIREENRFSDKIMLRDNHREVAR
jgi:hypothetical protein